MTGADLGAKIRELIASGALPAESAPITRPAPTSTPGNWKSRVLIGGPLHEPCTICGEPGPQGAQCFYIAGQIVRVHAACDGLWKVARSDEGGAP